MSADLVPDWRVQASFKFGIGQEHMLNVRADDFSELSELLESVPADLAGKLGSAAAALGLVTSVATATGDSVDVVSHAAPAQQQAGGPPLCAHGPRVYKKAKPGSGKTWEAFFCNTPQGASGKCDPIFKDKDNDSEPYWP